MKAVKKDLTGVRFGKLVVLYDTGERKNDRPMWMCRCDCGKQVSVRSKLLLNGNSTSCGCSRYEDLTGITFRRLTALYITPERKFRSPMWMCRCDCGNEKSFPAGRLKSGQAISCGECRWSVNRFELFDGYYIGHMTDGTTFIFDQCDYEKVKELSWSNKHGYVSGNYDGKSVVFHRFILGFPKGNVDHIDGDERNNRRCNLRIVTQQQNCFNSKKKLKNGSFSSQYKGVSRPKGNKKWQAQIRKGDDCYHLGWFENEIDAAKAYNEKAIELHGEYARINVF